MIRPDGHADCKFVMTYHNVQLEVVDMLRVDFSKIPEGGVQIEMLDMSYMTAMRRWEQTMRVPSWKCHENINVGSINPECDGVRNRTIFCQRNANTILQDRSS